MSTMTEKSIEPFKFILENEFPNKNNNNEGRVIEMHQVAANSVK